jgi:cytochrome c-type biogenesis protein CcmE
LSARTRPATLLGLILVAAALIALVGLALSSALVYYVTPTELAASPATGAVRLYGIVVPGSVNVEPGGRLDFALTDGSTTVAVVTEAVPTALFRDGVAVVLAGRLVVPGQFQAEQLLVKHSEVYLPLAPGESVPPGLLDELRASAP